MGRHESEGHPLSASPEPSAGAAGPLPEDWTLPRLTPLNRAWFTSGELAVQMCATCGTRQHPPEEICHACAGMALTTVTVAPQGTVHSFIVVDHAVDGTLVGSVPYIVALVSLDAAPEIRVVGNLLDVAIDEVAIGLPVDAVWQERTDPDTGELIRLPQWRRAATRPQPADSR